MTSSPTHSTRLARLASRDGILSYAQALALIKRARAEKRLPDILDDEGMQAALTVLRAMRDESSPQFAAPQDEILLGVSLGRDHLGDHFFLNTKELSMHTMLLGSTSLGKSTALKALISGMLTLGWSGTVLDLDDGTGTDNLRGFCAEAAANRHLAYQQVCAESPATHWLNPLEGLGPDEATGLLLSLYDFNDEYWESIIKKLISQLVNLCYDAHEADPAHTPYPTIFAIGSILEQANLNVATKKLRAALDASSIDVDMGRYSVLANPEPDMQKIALSLGSKLTQFYDTVGGSLVLSPKSDRTKPQLDTTSPGLSYIGVEAFGRPDLAELVSSAVLTSTTTFARSRLLSSQNFTQRFLVISGAAEVDTHRLVSLMSNARAGGISVVLAGESPSAFPEQVSQNINVHIITKQSQPSNALFCANIIASATGLTIRDLGDSEAFVHVDRPDTRESRISTFLPS